MSSAIKIEKNSLTINLAHLYDQMTEFDRLDFLDTVICGHSRLIEHVCQAVSGQGNVEPIFDRELRDACLLALKPLLDEAVGKSLADALAKAEKYERAERQLRSIAHVYSMLMESSGDMTRIRREQWDGEMRAMQKMYPEFQPQVTT